MKKEYKKPVIEITVTLCVSQPLMHSDDYIGAKDMNLDANEDDEPAQGTNLWDGWDD